MIEEEFDWVKACMAREEQHRIWSNHEENTEYFKYKEGLYAAVDTVHFMGVKFFFIEL